MLEQLFAGSGDTHDLQVRKRLQIRAQAVRDDTVVIDERDADCRSCLPHSRWTTGKTPPVSCDGDGPIAQRGPAHNARSGDTSREQQDPGHREHGRDRSRAGQIGSRGDAAGERDRKPTPSCPSPGPLASSKRAADLLRARLHVPDPHAAAVRRRSNPLPSSATSSTSARSIPSGARRDETVTWRARACRPMLASASCATRKIAWSAPGASAVGAGRSSG